MTGFVPSDRLDRQRWWGYTDLGPIQIPPQPFYTILTDRATGTFYYVTYDPNSPPAQHFLDQLGNIAIINASQSKLRDVGYGQIPTFSLFPVVGAGYAAYSQLYSVYNEPYISYMPQGYAARLFVRNGQLGAEIFAENDPNFTKDGYVSNINSPMIFALPQNGQTGFGNAFRRIRWADSSTIASFVGWDAWTVTQTPNPAPVNSTANLSNPAADV